MVFDTADLDRLGIEVPQDPSRVFEEGGPCVGGQERPPFDVLKTAWTRTLARDWGIN